MEARFLKAKIKCVIEEVVNIRTQGVNYKYLSKWDFDMEKSWDLKKKCDHRLNDKKAKRKNVTWQASSSGWMKLNFDDASRENLGRSGLGAIIRNDMEAELQWCVNNEVVNLIIEGDSQVILNGVTKSIFQNWRLECWIPRINKLLNSLGDYHIRHMYWEGNKAADYLANMGIEVDSVREVGREDMMSIGLTEIANDHKKATVVDILGLGYWSGGHVHDGRLVEYLFQPIIQDLGHPLSTNGILRRMVEEEIYLEVMRALDGIVSNP
ncbi:hypothetical protein SUGI_1191320 [Cryptomeria japonica]|nr:hypothetical protein SUGI_1191320 [Cryptomeria japonica]